MAAIIIIFIPTIIVSVICSCIFAKRTSISRQLTLVAGSLSTFLTTVAMGTGWMLVGFVLRTEEARQHQKLTFMEGWILFVIIYGGAALIAGFFTALICLLCCRNARLPEEPSTHP